MEEKYLHDTGSVAMDIYESKDHVFVEIDIAGVDPDDFSVSVEENQLTVEGIKREAATPEPGVLYHCVERGFGAFRRTFGIGSIIDSNNIEARLKNGVLLLKLPKLQDRRKTQIKVKVQVDG